MNGKFFNSMDFPVHFRLFWLPGNPAIKLEPGMPIEGPVEYLKTFSFLRPVPFDFNKVNAYTQDNRGQFLTLDKQIQNDIQNQESLAQKYRNQPQDLVAEKPIEPIIEAKLVDNPSVLELPFDPDSVNWVKITNSDLETACRVLQINMAEVDKMAPKKKKWEMIRLIKKALGRI
jgi:hypothetical protein